MEELFQGQTPKESPWTWHRITTGLARAWTIVNIDNVSCVTTSTLRLVGPIQYVMKSKGVGIQIQCVQEDDADKVAQQFHRLVRRDSDTRAIVVLVVVNSSAKHTYSLVRSRAVTYICDNDHNVAASVAAFTTPPTPATRLVQALRGQVLVPCVRFVVDKDAEETWQGRMCQIASMILVLLALLKGGGVTGNMFECNISVWTRAIAYMWAQQLDVDKRLRHCVLPYFWRYSAGQTARFVVENPRNTGSGLGVFLASATMRGMQPLMTGVNLNFASYLGLALRYEVYCELFQCRAVKSEWCKARHRDTGKGGGVLAATVTGTLENMVRAGGMTTLPRKLVWSALDAMGGHSRTSGDVHAWKCVLYSVFKHLERVSPHVWVFRLLGEFFGLEDVCEIVSNPMVGVTQWRFQSENKHKTAMWVLGALMQSAQTRGMSNETFADACMLAALLFTG